MIISGVLIILGLVFLLSNILSSSSSNSNSRELFNKKSGLLTNLVFFLMTELLPLPYLTLFLAPLSCSSVNPLNIGYLHTRIRHYKKKLNICVSGSNLVDVLSQENLELRKFLNFYYFMHKLWFMFCLFMHWNISISIGAFLRGPLDQSKYFFGENTQILLLFANFN